LSTSDGPSGVWGKKLGVVQAAKKGGSAPQRGGGVAKEKEQQKGVPLGGCRKLERIAGHCCPDEVRNSSGTKRTGG